MFARTFCTFLVIAFSMRASLPANAQSKEEIDAYINSAKVETAAKFGVSGVARNRRRRRRRKSDTRVPKRDEIPRECRPIGKVELRILKDEARVAEYWHAERLGLRCASKCEHGESNSEKVPHGLIPLG